MRTGGPDSASEPSKQDGSAPRPFPRGPGKGLAAQCNTGKFGAGHVRSLGANHAMGLAPAFPRSRAIITQASQRDLGPRADSGVALVRPRQGKDSLKPSLIHQG